jgi:hypothetical protein
MAKKKTPRDLSTPQAPPRRRATTTKKPAVATLANDSATATMTPPDPGNGGRPEPTQAEIAEAAYYRHLNRSGSGGDEFTDWIEAERELKQRR